MPNTHTHTIESGNARVSVEADDANLAVSEAGRNWALNNGGVVSDDIATPTHPNDVKIIHLCSGHRNYKAYPSLACSCCDPNIESKNFSTREITDLVNHLLPRKSVPVGDIARRIASKLCGKAPELCPQYKTIGHHVAVDQHAAMVHSIAAVIAPELAPLVQRAEEAERKREELVAKLPKTADGVPIVLGRMVFVRTPIARQFVIDQMIRYENGVTTVASGRSEFGLEVVYSTREAALAAVPASAGDGGNGK